MPDLYGGFSLQFRPVTFKAGAGVTGITILNASEPELYLTFHGHFSVTVAIESAVPIRMELGAGGAAQGAHGIARVAVHHRLIGPIHGYAGLSGGFGWQRLTQENKERPGSVTRSWATVELGVMLMP